MEEKDFKRNSNFLSLVLRHRPELIGILPDGQGWVEVNALLAALAGHGQPLSPGELEQLVATNSKKRFAFNADHSKIRASQGHSIDIDLELPASVPPAILYHGTAIQHLNSIHKNGLLPGSRRFVHLSDNTATAIEVGRRHGQPVVLEIDCSRMLADGFLFYLSENEVWLAAAVPVTYIHFPG